MKKPFDGYSAFIVDDTNTARITQTGILDDLGVSKIKTLTDGIQVIPSLEKGSLPDFILLDWTMREMHGIDALKAIRAHEDEKIKKIPVIMVTAEVKRDNIIAAIKAGATDYVTKPYTGGTIETKLKRIFKL